MPELDLTDVIKRLDTFEHMQTQVLGRLNSIEEDRKEVRVAYQDRFHKIEKTVYGDDDSPGLREETRYIKKTISEELVPAINNTSKTLQENNAMLNKILIIGGSLFAVFELVMKFGFHK